MLPEGPRETEQNIYFIDLNSTVSRHNKRFILGHNKCIHGFDNKVINVQNRIAKQMSVRDSFSVLTNQVWHVIYKTKSGDLTSWIRFQNINNICMLSPLAW